MTPSTPTLSTPGGPLKGVKIVEFAGIGPAPFCAMLLADMGADIIRIDRVGAAAETEFDLTLRGRRSVALNLKDAEDIKIALALLERADVLIEGFRPGVMERLGLGPDAVLGRNSRLIYGRMTGWGQSGPLAHAAAHDINFLAITGGLYAMGAAEAPPPPPLNLVGDYGGGAMYLALGICAALIEARSSGQGQVIDCAIVDGVASLLTTFHGMLASGDWIDKRAANLVDGGAPFYCCYVCKDGKWVSVGAIEPHFYAALLEKLGLGDNEELKDQKNAEKWQRQKEVLAQTFATRTRQEWCDLLEGSDVCFAPVLDWSEATRHAHLRARSVYGNIAGIESAMPAPRFSRTPSTTAGQMAKPGEHTAEVLAEWGVSR